MDYIMALVPESIKALPVHMDFTGQKRAERTFQIIILLFGAVGFVWGYICQQFSQTMYILLAGVALSCILTLPPWSMYRKNPLQWQKARPEVGTADNTSSAVAPASSNPQKSKKKK
ncbi:signal peptidase complex subunit 1-like [Babylonia areolata]|uniref:signal peptidase complex subunit 1-like n=1 Tax=Babylonia areolata TaxID=304850 RepID=UPI003FD4C079